MDDHEALDVYQQCLGELLLALAGRQTPFISIHDSFTHLFCPILLLATEPLQWRKSLQPPADVCLCVCVCVCVCVC